MSKRHLCFLLWLLSISALSALFNTSLAADSGYRQVVDGVAIYFGIVPAELVHGHPKGHFESQMHGGVPTDVRHHIIFAVFDSATGERITDAQLSAKVSAGDQSGPWKELEPMIIAGARSYGNYFRMPGAGPYRIAVIIRRPGKSRVIRVSFEWARA